MLVALCGGSSSVVRSNKHRTAVHLVEEQYGKGSVQSLFYVFGSLPHQSQGQ
jgi:hypothetical protein